MPGNGLIFLIVSLPGVNCFRPEAVAHVISEKDGMNHPTVPSKKTRTLDNHYHNSL
ncbi:MAG TPA: hypothetical protein VFN35_06660 [Ktedonobacteraceae bacterium]|nr:hypothetical protein [Ktedonobacteraceae bacterium]